MATKSAVSLLARHRQLAPSASIFVSPLCLGTMNFGDAMSGLLGECDKPTSFSILDHFFDQGGNFIDTANAYQKGQTETWLGEWIASRQNRDQLVLATKYSGRYTGFESETVKIGSNYGGNGTKSMKLSLENSLRKLQTSYVDILYVHWWDYTTSIPELMHSLNDLVVAGKVLYLGISDCPAWVAAKANQYARDNGLRPFVVYQGQWNAAMRDLEREIVPMCRAEGMGIVPYGVLNQGRFQPEATFVEREKNNGFRNHTPVSQRDKDVSRVLETLANARKDTQLTDVALAYIMQKEPYVFPVVGGRKLDHLKSNIEGLSVALPDEDVATIDLAYNFDPGFPHTFLSGSLLAGADAPQKMAGRPSEVWLTKFLGTFDWVEPPKAIRPPASSA
jgi:aryl-alcohol dehydrogenase-like predicted oxidoreductase